MRIGLTGGGSTVDKLVQQAREAEERGFTALWYASSVLRDPLTAMAIVGGKPRVSNWERRCCRPIRAIPSCRPTAPQQRPKQWDDRDSALV